MILCADTALCAKKLLLFRDRRAGWTILPGTVLRIGAEGRLRAKESRTRGLSEYLRFGWVGLGWVPCSGPVIPEVRLEV